MLEFMSMIDNYEDRKVSPKYDKDGVFVSTAAINDSDKPFETAIAHFQYNDNEIIIVELYDTKEEAQKGHAKWIKKMTSKNLPDSIKDVSTCTISKLGDLVGDFDRENKRESIQ